MWKGKTIKLLEENIEEYLYEFEKKNYILFMIQIIKKIIDKPDYTKFEVFDKKA